MTELRNWQLNFGRTSAETRLTRLPVFAHDSHHRLFICQYSRLSLLMLDSIKPGP